MTMTKSNAGGGVAMTYLVEAAIRVAYRDWTLDTGHLAIPLWLLAQAAYLPAETVRAALPHIPGTVLSRPLSGASEHVTLHAREVAP